VIDPLARVEMVLKKHQREALFLNNYLTFNRFTSGRSNRERKPATILLVSFRPKLTLLKLKRRKI
jgi:hypothetical protein